MYVTIARSVPDIQLDSMPLAVDCHVDDLTEVRYHICAVRFALRLKMAFHERLDYASFSNLAVAHEDDFGSFDLGLVARNSEVGLLGYIVTSSTTGSARITSSSVWNALLFLASTTTSFLLLLCFDHLRTKL